MPDPLRNVRVPTPLWQRFTTACRERGTTASSVLRNHMIDYIKEQK